ncbi:MAG: hypothetical protein WDM70_05150 [Nitrosomonadales bacterium]
METLPDELKPYSRLLFSFVLITATLILAACGEKSQPAEPSASQSAPTQLFQQQRDALDTAKAVGQTEAKSTEEIKREEEKQTK